MLWLIGFLILILVLPCNAYAVESYDEEYGYDDGFGSDYESIFEYGDYLYWINEYGSATLTGYFGDEKDVIVPDTVGEISVTALAGTFFGNGMIRTVTVPEGIKDIGEKTFWGCTNLTYVDFKSKDELHVFVSAFSGATKLRAVRIESKEPSKVDLYYDEDELMQEVFSRYKFVSSPYDTFYNRLPRTLQIIYLVVVESALIIIAYQAIMMLSRRINKRYELYKTRVYDNIGARNEDTLMIFKERIDVKIRRAFIIGGLIIVLSSIYSSYMQDAAYYFQFVFVKTPKSYKNIITIINEIVLPVALLILVVVAKQKREKKNSIYSKSKIKVTRISR